MIRVGPDTSDGINLNDTFEVEQHDSFIFIAGVEEYDFYAVDCLSVGRAIEDGDDLPRVLLQVPKIILHQFVFTPDQRDVYSPKYSRSIVMSTGPLPLTPKSSKAISANKKG